MLFRSLSPMEVVENESSDFDVVIKASLRSFEDFSDVVGEGSSGSIPDSHFSDSRKQQHKWAFPCASAGSPTCPQQRAALTNKPMVWCIEPSAVGAEIAPAAIVEAVVLRRDLVNML